MPENWLKLACLRGLVTSKHVAFCYWSKSDKMLCLAHPLRTPVLPTTAFICKTNFFLNSKGIPSKGGDHRWGLQTDISISSRSPVRESELLPLSSIRWQLVLIHFKQFTFITEFELLPLIWLSYQWVTLEVSECFGTKGFFFFPHPKWLLRQSHNAVITTG